MSRANFRKRREFILGNALVILSAIAVLAWLTHSVSTQLDYKWRWEKVIPFLLYEDDVGSWRAGLILEGLAGTVRLTVFSGIGAMLVALPIALLLLSPVRVFRILGNAYVEMLRNMPPLVFMFVFYFFISSQIVSGWDVGAWAEENWGDSGLFPVIVGDAVLLENYISGMLCLVAFEAAYIAEIYRAGIQSISRGQYEASYSLGLSRFKVFRLIVAPQALARISPPLASQIITLVKDSSIISVISIQELTFTGVEAAVSSGQFFEVWLIVAILYFGLSYPISFLFRRLETRRVSAGQR